MSQNFNKLLGSSIIKNDRATINENFDAIRSAYSGTAFPTQELIAGMEFFNTSTKKLYRLQADLTTWTLELDLSSGTAIVAKASNADTAGKALKDANGKDISTYVAKFESDVNNAFVINVYDGDNNKLGSVTIPETKVETMTGASSSSAGKAGLVPAPTAGAKNRYLNAYGEFDEIDFPVKSVNGKTGDVVVDVGVTSVNKKTGAVTLKESPSDMTDYIVESYRNETEWYEVYKSGKVRQGGWLAATSSGRTATITFLKPFANTKYNPLGMPTGGTLAETITWQYAGVVYGSNKNATNMQVRVGPSNRCNGYTWVAEGQGA